MIAMKKAREEGLFVFFNFLCFPYRTEINTALWLKICHELFIKLSVYFIA